MVRGQSCRECRNETTFCCLEEAKTLIAAGNNPPAAFSSQSAAVAAVGSRGDAPRDIGGYGLKLIYSGESNRDTRLKKQLRRNIQTCPTWSRQSESRSAMSLAERRDIFGSSDESEAPSPRWCPSLESDRGGGKSQFNDDDGDSVMLHD